MRVYLAPKVLIVDEFGLWPYDRSRPPLSSPWYRPLHHSHVTKIRGESYRLKDKRQAGIFPSHRLLNPAPEPFNNQ